MPYKYESEKFKIANTNFDRRIKLTNETDEKLKEMVNDLNKIGEKIMSGDICTDNRFEIIKRAKEYIINNTNIETSADEMKVLDNFLFRMWQLGLLEEF